MAVRIEDIARDLNISAMTVSRVLNRREGTYIAPQTIERVLQAAAKMGYRPNRYARALATGRTHTIGVWISHLHSSVYTQIAKSCREEIERSGLQAAISEMHWHFPGPGSHPRLDWQVDGVLAVDPPEPDTLATLLNDAVLHSLPRVNLGSGRAVEWEGDYVRVDLCEGTRAAVDHLASLGCKRIAYALPYGIHLPGGGNTDAYLNSMQKAGLEPEMILHRNWDMDSVRRDVRGHVQAHGCPDGLYCHNDEIAIAAFRAVRDMKLRVPDDVMIIGCEGSEFMAYFDPSLSTISMPIQRMCQQAWNLLERRLQHTDAPPEQIILLHEFLQRESSLRK
jgi:DNA-binding LacI/PurR family transcriptional regulator